MLVATAAFFLVGRLLGPGIAGLPGRRRQRGLFGGMGDGDREGLEFGYCFDVGDSSDSVGRESQEPGSAEARNCDDS